MMMRRTTRTMHAHNACIIAHTSNTSNTHQANVLPIISIIHKHKLSRVRYE